MGDYINVTGAWVDHPVHKKQFKVKHYQHLVPRTPEELMVFLSSGVITGIGPHFAKQLVETFGERLIYILDKEPKELSKISGIGSKKVAAIESSWKLHRQQLSFLQYVMQFDIDFKLAKRIWSKFYDDAFDICQNNPYQLITSVRGFNFDLADKIGNRNPALLNSDIRISAVIDDMFQSYYSSSNVWMEFDQFYQKLQSRLQIGDEILQSVIQQKQLAQDIVIVSDNLDNQWITQAYLSDCECRIMDGIQELCSMAPIIDIQPQKAVEWVINRLSIQLSPDQVAALEGLLSDPVTILYGGPGTGKTTLLRAYVEIVAKKTTKIICMAPTGKAAKRLAEQVGRRASTIHSLMDYDEKEHLLTPKPLDCDICIVDEMSMVDMFLFQDILTMVSAGVRLVLVGDPDQLPSIGPGQVFYDLINQSQIASFQLHTNHRQVNQRGIVTLAQMILKREPIYTPLGDDISLLSEQNPDVLEQKINQLFLTTAPNQHQLSIHDIQLLVPLHKGRFGIDQVNRNIAQQIRPIELRSERWAVGDRVMQCRNNYTKRVMNGDIGLIHAIKPNEIVIRFDHRLIDYEYTDMDDIRLAYAVSVHKFQGSEAPIIIMPIIRQWKFFMTMDVLYTAITRAKKHLYIIGELDVFNEMISNSKHTQRLTRLFQ